MASDHEELRESAGVYALGAMSADERARFEAHLRVCEECRREVESLGPIVTGLAMTVPYCEPAIALRDRVLAVAGASPASPVERAPEIPSSAYARPVKGRWALGALAAAASIAAVLLGWYALTLRTELVEMSARLRETEIRLTAAEAEAADARVIAAQAQTAVTVLAAPDLLRVELAGQPPAANARGRVFWSPSRGLLFTASNLPALPPGRTYQLWIVTPQAAISAGLLRPGADGAMTASLPTPASATPALAMAVTLEPEGGVPSPTGEKGPASERSPNLSCS